jgi:hypothetical protein
MTRPSVLAGPESAQEHIRNALQLLASARGTVQVGPNALPIAVISAGDLDAARARLRAALAMLEGKP